LRQLSRFRQPSRRQQTSRASSNRRYDRALRGVTHPVLAAAGDKARAAVRHAESWLAGGKDQESLEAGARRLALTLGLALVYLGEHYVVDLLAGLVLTETVRRQAPRAAPLVGAVSRVFQRLEVQAGSK